MSDLNHNFLSLTIIACFSIADVHNDFVAEEVIVVDASDGQATNHSSGLLGNRFENIISKYIHIQNTNNISQNIQTENLTFEPAERNLIGMSHLLQEILRLLSSERLVS